MKETFHCVHTEDDSECDISKEEETNNDRKDIGILHRRGQEVIKEDSTELIMSKT